jgi:hypothetical protein
MKSMHETSDIQIIIKPCKINQMLSNKEIKHSTITSIRMFHWNKTIQKNHSFSTL